MKINGDWQDGVTREFAARSGAMARELAQLGEKLSTPRPAVAPAVPLSDTVRISPEARAIVNGFEPADLPLRPFPSPSELVSAFRGVLDAETAAGRAEAAAALAGVVRRLAEGLPGTAVPFRSPDASSELAQAIVRALLSPRPAGAEQDLDSLVGMVRELLSTPGTTNEPFLPAPTALDRAIAALVFAAIRYRAASGEVLPGQLPAREGLPPALYALAAGELPHRPKKRPKRKQAAFVPDEDPEETAGERESAAYRSSPRRK